MGRRFGQVLKFIGITALTISILMICLDRQGVPGRIADYPAERASKQVASESSIADLPWYLEKVNAADTWKDTAAGAHILIAVLDTGIDVKHEDLAGKVIDSVNFSASPTTNDVNGHGTFIAGIIGASMENLKGATGVAFKSSLLNVKVANDNGFVQPEAVARGITWAVDRGARVINLSLTLSNPSSSVEEAVQYAWSKGVVIVAATGNIAGTRPVYPAASPNVIGVAATDQNDRMTKWSTRGDWVSVSAPGVDIYSTLPSDTYTYRNGTSYSAALVSGEAALLFAVAVDKNRNGVTGDEVSEAILHSTATRTDGAGAGRIDVLKAVNYLVSNS